MATYNAASPSFSDVSAAVALSTHGDTVTVPAGSSNWGSDKLRITKAISLIGAGDTLTTITRAAEMIRFAVTTAGQEDTLVRVSGIHFNNTTEDGPSLVMQGKAGGDDPGPGTPNVLNHVRIDNCKFTGGSRSIRNSGRVFGVIDHCEFNSGDTVIGNIGNSNTAWEDFGDPFVPGTINAMVIEDCVFNLPASYNGATQIYNEDGAIVVVRNNEFYATTGDPSFVECHGNQNYYTGTSADYRSTISVEVYDNYFEMTINNYRYLNFRGGTILVYNNDFNDLSGGTPLIRLDEEEAHQTAFFSPLATVWPAEDQIKNSFFWNNTLNAGAPATYVDFADDVADEIGVFIQVNRDYWLAAPSGSNGSPPGVFENYAALEYPHPFIAESGGGGGSEPPNCVLSGNVRLSGNVSFT